MTMKSVMKAPRARVDPATANPLPRKSRVALGRLQNFARPGLRRKEVDDLCPRVRNAVEHDVEVGGNHENHECGRRGLETERLTPRHPDARGYLHRDRDDKRGEYAGERGSVGRGVEGYPAGHEVAFREVRVDTHPKEAP
ncbi:hypothetical protein [Aeromicrobium sp. Root495]|uniref:hypothetical protein n=1 Tax=Aeromicrobium sp. Root495 TaxID=1736550 RepID=UPI0012E77BE4|nr:hypothetical protein [Aeromicrobium sp. Root495]